MIRRFRPTDAQPTRDVFVAAVRIGAAGRYSEAERLDWVPDPTMPEDWGDWLHGHITLVAEAEGRVIGFMMVERNGYLNMAFVAPDQMGKGVADALYTALLAEVQALGLTRLTTLASRYSQGFFRRHGWVYPTDLSDFTGHHDYDPNQGPDQNPTNRPMSLTLKAAP